MQGAKVLGDCWRRQLTVVIEGEAHWLLLSCRPLATPLVHHLEQLGTSSIQGPGSEIVLACLYCPGISPSVPWCTSFIYFFDGMWLKTSWKERVLSPKSYLIVGFKRTVHCQTVGITESSMSLRVWCVSVVLKRSTEGQRWRKVFLSLG